MNKYITISLFKHSRIFFRLFLLLSIAFLSNPSFAQPVAKFSFLRSSTCYKAGDAIIVTFTDESLGGAHTTEWTFGDGGQSKNANPTWTYTAAGVYYVTLTIKTPANETSSITQQVVIFPALDIKYVSDQNKGCLPLKIVFTDLTKDLEIKDPISGVVYKEKISSRQWSFGDGIISTTDLSTVLHTYTRAGLKDVSLSVLTEGGCTDYKQTRNIVNVFKPARADFYLPEPNTCQYPVTVQSINTSVDASTYKWNVSGPAPVTISNDTATNANFIFSKAGTYTIKLVAVSDSGCSNEMSVNYVLPSTAIAASFTSLDSACLNTTIKFTNTSSPDPIANNWFINGVQVDTQKDLNYLFNVAGIFKVKLESQIGSCVASFEKNIVINDLPIVKFGADTLEACSFPFAVKFADSSSGSVVKRIWDFGDGSTLTELPPFPASTPHTFNREGGFSVRLTLTSNKNCVATKLIQNMIVVQFPRVIKTNFPDSGCIPFKVTPDIRFTNESEIAIWEWEYTDIRGNVLLRTTGPSPDPYIITDSGRYQVRLRIVTARGCEKSFSWDVKAGFRPNPFDFTSTPLDDCASKTFVFKYIGESVTGYKWFFNGADSVYDAEPMKKFKKLGPVDVKLVVYQFGCPRDTLKKQFVNVRGVITSFSVLNECANPMDRLVIDNSVGKIESWELKYGDGFSDSYTTKKDSIRHVYAQPGQYTVSLKVAGDNCEYIDSIKINVSDERKINFNLGKMPVCIADTFMNLIAVVDKPQFIKSYNWDLGCGFTGPGSSATLKVNLSSLCKYPNTGGRGLYSMQLRIIDTNNCVITSPIKDVFVGGPISSYAALSATSGCQNLPVQFRDNSSNDGVSNVVSRLWNFGDGSPVQNILSGPVQHIFSNVGSFPVTLTITDGNGCISSKSSVIVNTSNPDLDFVALDTASCLNKSIQLEARSSVRFTNFQWNLDDGRTSNLSNPRVSYDVTGRKTITLSARDLVGCIRNVTKTAYINIDMPVASFYTDKDTADCPPFNANFQFTGNFADTYSWDFGDGTTSSASDPRHLFAQSGTYAVTLTVTSPGGCVSTTANPLFIVVNGPRGTVSFNPNICEPFNAVFNVNPQNTQHVLIDYGDGNLSDSLPVSNQYTYKYADTGFYQPKVFLVNDANCRVLLKTSNGMKTISLEPKFSSDINFLCDNGFVTFTDRTVANETLTNWQWDFGDGRTGTGSRPTHFYTSPGFYSVKLNVGSQSGCVDTLTRTTIIEVQARPDIGISSSKAIICEDDVVQFQGVEVTPNNSPIVSWFWDFTNGNSASIQNPVVQLFRKAGTYPFRLYATNSKGCSDTLLQNFVVNANPILDAGQDINLCLGKPVQLSPKGAATYQWDPGPSISCLNCPAPIINPVRDTVYRVRGFSTVGCTAVDSLSVRVVYPTVVTAMRDTFVCEGNSVQLQASGTQLYSWSPSTGLNKTDIASPIAKPGQTITYRVTGSDPYNCFVTTDDVVVRYVPNPLVDAGRDTTVMAGYPFALRSSYSNDVTRVQWVPSLFLNCSDCKFPVSTPSYSATYTLFAYTAEGCMSKDVVNVFVTCTKENLYIPNTFSPNGDGMNEVFYPRGRGVEKIKSMKLFSRWGQLVYEKTNFMANDMNAGWNGKRAGQFVTPDVYVYMIELVCENGNIITLKGDVTLVR